MAGKVAIIMGSKSDIEIMRKAESVLKKFGIEYEMDIMSAHRTPEKTAVFAKTAKENGFKVIICGAGLSAHLAGVVAAHTNLPVIGVPLISSSGPNGLDALLSTVQMPKGVPVACVALNGAYNAALLAVKILALEDKNLNEKLNEFKEEMKKEIESYSQKLKNGEL